MPHKSSGLGFAWDVRATFEVMSPPDCGEPAERLKCSWAVEIHDLFDPGDRAGALSGISSPAFRCYPNALIPDRAPREMETPFPAPVDASG